MLRKTTALVDINMSWGYTIFPKTPALVDINMSWGYATENCSISWYKHELRLYYFPFFLRKRSISSSNTVEPNNLVEVSNLCCLRVISLKQHKSKFEYLRLVLE